MSISFSIDSAKTKNSLAYSNTDITQNGLFIVQSLHMLPDSVLGRTKLIMINVVTEGRVQNSSLFKQFNL